MSLEIFKQNMLSYMRNQPGINSYGEFAKKLTLEYDMAVKRGMDTVNGVTLGKGNTELMEATLNGILATALQQPSGEHPIITNMGPAFIAYWTGGSMAAGPPPVIPSPGAVINIATVGSMITNPGTWQPTDFKSLEPIPFEPTPDEPGEPTTEELLAKIPNDNNTVDGARKIVSESGTESLTDENDDGQDNNPQTNSVKEALKDSDESQYAEKQNPEEVAVTTSSVESKNPACGTGVDYDAQLSPNFKLKHLSIATLFPHRIKSQVGLSEEDIVCNLKNVAQNILEPLKAKYPNMRVNSAFRGTPSLAGGKVSQHQKGEAIDVQFTGISPNGYLPIAKWIAGTLPFDQMIFEHGNTIWLHISCKRGGPQRKKLTTMYKGNYEDGLKLYYS
jgi:hypothetical protein